MKLVVRNAQAILDRLRNLLHDGIMVTLLALIRLREKKVEARTITLHVLQELQRVLLNGSGRHRHAKYAYALFQDKLVDCQLVGLAGRTQTGQVHQADIGIVLELGIVDIEADTGQLAPVRHAGDFLHLLKVNSRQDNGFAKFVILPEREEYRAFVIGEMQFSSDCRFGRNAPWQQVHPKPVIEQGTLSA